VSDCCECGDEPSGSCATELVSLYVHIPEIKDSCDHKVVVQSACDTDRV
jgi:hypothetical protein